MSRLPGRRLNACITVEKAGGPDARLAQSFGQADISCLIEGPAFLLNGIRRQRADISNALWAQSNRFEQVNAFRRTPLQRPIQEGIEEIFLIGCGLEIDEGYSLCFVIRVGQQLKNRVSLERGAFLHGGDPELFFLQRKPEMPRQGSSRAVRQQFVRIFCLQSFPKGLESLIEVLATLHFDVPVQTILLVAGALPDGVLRV